MFPVEIVEIFFKHSSGVDIINFRNVCRTWKCIINRLSKDTDMWKIRCRNEIPVHDCRSILSKLYPEQNWTDFDKSEEYLKWLKIYQTWIKWQRINDTMFHTEQFEPFFIRLPTVTISCVTVSGDLIAVGSSEGFIATYAKDSTEEPLFTVDQLEYVSDIAFYRDDVHIIAISTSPLDNVMSWDFRSKEAIGNKEYGRLISTSQRCVWIAMRHKLIVKQSKHVNKTYQFPEINGTIIALVADGPQAFIWTNLGYSYKINVNNNPGADCIEEFVEPPSERVCNYYLFMPWIAVCVTVDGFLGICVDGHWVMYEVLSKLHGVPTSVLFYVNILVLGLDSGSVHVFNINNVESLSNLDLRSENSKLIVVDNEAIIALDIMECPNKQYLIAATGEKVNIIEIKHFD